MASSAQPAPTTPPLSPPPEPTAEPWRITFEHEADGRWRAEIPVLPGVHAYGATRAEALARTEALALRVFADRLEHETPPNGPLTVAFVLDPLDRARHAWEDWDAEEIAAEFAPWPNA